MQEALAVCLQAGINIISFSKIIANATIAVIIECHHNLSSNRLTEDPETQVLLLEAGPKYVSTDYALLVCCLFWCQWKKQISNVCQPSLKLDDSRDTALGSKALMWKIHMPAALTYNLCDDK